MNIEQMHRRINLRLQKIDSGAYDNILPEEIDEYINLAQERFIKKRFEPRSNRFGLGFEQSIKRIEDLRNLIPRPYEVQAIHYRESPVTNIYIDMIRSPKNMFLPISVGVEVYVNRKGIEFTVDNHRRVPLNDYSTVRTRAFFVQQDDVYSVLEDPFNKPSSKRILFTLSEEGILTYTDNTSIVNKIILTYIRQPKQVSLSEGIDSEIAFPEEITEDAVKLILSDIEAFGPEGKLMALSDSE